MLQTQEKSGLVFGTQYLSGIHHLRRLSGPCFRQNDCKAVFQQARPTDPGVRPERPKIHHRIVLRRWGQWMKAAVKVYEGFHVGDYTSGTPACTIGSSSRSSSTNHSCGGTGNR